MALELYNPYIQDAYTKPSNVYMLGYVISMMIDFWKFAQHDFLNTEWMEHPDYQRIYLLEDQVNWQMLNYNIVERISLLELDLWITEKLTTEP